jgi:hypothetical protein
MEEGVKDRLNNDRESSGEGKWNDTKMTRQEKLKKNEEEVVQRKRSHKAPKKRRRKICLFNAAASTESLQRMWQDD